VSFKENRTKVEVK